MNRPKIAVLSDFDGTISLEDVGANILRRFVAPAYKKHQQDWIEHKIGSKECYRLEYSHLFGTEEEILQFVQTVKLDPALPELLELCDRQNWEFAICSDGFDLYIDPLLAANDLSEIRCYSNRMYFQDGKLKLEFPNAHPRCDFCGNCKAGLVYQYQNAGYKVIYLGDSYSDRFPAYFADLVFAKNKLIRYCQAVNLPYVPFSRFSQVVSYLQEAVAGEQVSSLFGNRRPLGETDEGWHCRQVLEGNVKEATG